jgi:hypothetical protein
MSPSSVELFCVGNCKFGIFANFAVCVGLYGLVLVWMVASNVRCTKTYCALSKRVIVRAKYGWRNDKKTVDCRAGSLLAIRRLLHEAGLIYLGLIIVMKLVWCAYRV